MDLLDAPSPPQSVDRCEDDASALTDVALLRATRQALSGAEKMVFINLAGLIARCIDRQIHRRLGFDSFGRFALASGNGLGASTNGKLWLLRCSMDIAGKHIKEWGEVLLQVETNVRLDAKKSGVGLNKLRGNSLRTLAHQFGEASICYLPTAQTGYFASDGNLIRLQKRRPELFERVAAREITLAQARREAGFIMKRSKFEQIKKWLPSLTAAERVQLRELLA